MGQADNHIQQRVEAIINRYAKGNTIAYAFQSEIILNGEKYSCPLTDCGKFRTVIEAEGITFIV